MPRKKVPLCSLWGHDKSTHLQHADLRGQFVLRRRQGMWRPVPVQAEGDDSEADESDDDGDKKKAKKKSGKGGLLVMGAGPVGSPLSPRARKATLTRNLSTSSILAQMKETAKMEETAGTN